MRANSDRGSYLRPNWVDAYQWIKPQDAGECIDQCLHHESCVFVVYDSNRGSDQCSFYKNSTDEYEWKRIPRKVFVYQKQLETGILQMSCK